MAFHKIKIFIYYGYQNINNSQYFTFILKRKGIQKENKGKVDF